MFCRQCGAEIDEDAAFCSKCGYKREQTEAQPEVYYEEQENYSVHTVRKKSVRKTISGVIVLIWGAVLIFLTLAGGDEMDDVSPQVALLIGIVVIAIGIFLFVKGVNGEEEQYVYKDGGPGISMFDKAPGTWTCSKCGKVNANFIGTCSCGQSRV